MNATSSFAVVQAAIPAELLSCSGKVFYSGRDAFSGSAPLYVLGSNPGGDPNSQTEQTVEAHTNWVAAAAPSDWSAYRDEEWKGKPAGKHGMQPRMLHLFRVLGLNPGKVPASNLVFQRSRREAEIANQFEHLAGLCWPFHSQVIERMQPKVILCLGKTAGEFVRGRVGAYEPVDAFTEQNERKWQSLTFRSQSGVKVVVATHPSIANWSAGSTDPTSLVARALRDA